jgi:hypothetical protein
MHPIAELNFRCLLLKKVGIDMFQAAATLWSRQPVDLAARFLSSDSDPGGRAP